LGPLFGIFGSGDRPAKPAVADVEYCERPGRSHHHQSTAAVHDLIANKAVAWHRVGPLERAVTGVHGDDPGVRADLVDHRDEQVPTAPLAVYRSG
jgi:hypothetical protein